MKFEFKTELKNFTLFARNGGNSKTGKGLMVSILPKNGIDLNTVRSKGSSSCGDCTHARAKYGRKHGTCYTYKRPAGGQGVLGGIQSGFLRCETIDLSSFINKATVLAELSGFIRIGEFGDAGADKETALTIASLLNNIDKHVNRAGYSHQWKKSKALPLRGLLMSSCDNLEEEREARADGWATFTVFGRKDEIKKNWCPSQKSKGSINCADCSNCDGREGKRVYINMH